MCLQTVKKTTINETGLGDEQYTALMKSLEEGGVNLEALGTSLNAQGVDVDKLLTDMGTANLGISNLQTGQTDIGNRIGTAGADGTDATGLYGAISGLGSGLRTDFGTALTGAQDALSGQIGTGFNTVAGRFDTVDTNMLDNRAAMDKGFFNVGGRFDTVDTNMANNRSALDTGFKNVGSAFDAQNTGLTNAFETAEGEQAKRATELGGQMQTAEQNLAQRLSDLSGNQDTYYSDLAANQATMQDNQANYQSRFDDYVQRYGEDTELASQARADLQTGLVNTADLVRDDIGRVLQAQTAGQNNLTNQQANLSDLVASQTDQLGNQLYSGFNQVLDSNAGLMATQTDTLSNQMNDVRDLVNDSSVALDQGVRQQFAQLTRAFDNSGRLLKNQILADGTIVSRNMTPDGMLSEDYFNSAGQVIGKKSFDVNNMLADAQRYTNP